MFEISWSKKDKKEGNERRERIQSPWAFKSEDIRNSRKKKIPEQPENSMIRKLWSERGREREREREREKREGERIVVVLVFFVRFLVWLVWFSCGFTVADCETRTFFLVFFDCENTMSSECDNASETNNQQSNNTKQITTKKRPTLPSLSHCSRFEKKEKPKLQILGVS